MPLILARWLLTGSITDFRHRRQRSLVQDVINAVASVTQARFVEQVYFAEVESCPRPFRCCGEIPVEKLSMPRTDSPRLTNSRASDEPMNPATPVIRYFAIELVLRASKLVFVYKMQRTIARRLDAVLPDFVQHRLVTDIEDLQPRACGSIRSASECA